MWRGAAQAMRRVGFSPVNFAIAVAVAGLALMALLTYFVMPVDDDFCFGEKFRQLGFRQSVEFFYLNWTGRLPLIVLSSLPELAAIHWGFDPIATYQLMALGMIVSITAFGMWASRQLLPGLAGAPLVGLVLAAALIANARSVSDLIYWLSATPTYTIPAILMGIVFLVLTNSAIGGKPVSRPGKYGLVLAIFLAATCNEFTWLIGLITVGASEFLRWRLHGKLEISAFAVGLCAAAIAGGALAIAAPGNSARFAATGGGDLSGTMYWPFVYYFNYLVLRVDAYGSLGWLVLLSVLTLVNDRLRPPVPQAAAREAIWVPLAVAVLAGLATFAVGYYAVSGGIPGRVQNEFQFLALVALSLSSQAAVRRYRGSVRRLIGQGRPRVRLRAAVIAGAVLLAFSLGHIKAVATLVDGAAQYRADSLARFEMLRMASGPDVSVPALGATPLLFMPGGLDQDPTNWVNRCIASHFGHETVRLER